MAHIRHRFPLSVEEGASVDIAYLLRRKLPTALIPVFALGALAASGPVRAGHPGMLPHPVDESVLDDLRARENTGTLQIGQLGRITEQAVLRDNSVIGGQSGDNLLGAGVLDNARGIATVIQNSGHNVIIQDALIVNITVAP